MKALVIALAVLAHAPLLRAQNDLGKADDTARIALYAHVPSNSDGIPAGARENLTNKLNQIATANGLGGGAANQPFIITAHVVVVDKVIQPGAPSMTVLNLDLSLYVGDGIEGTLFSSATKSIKGVGENETKAYINALKNIQVKDPAFAEMLEAGKRKIIEYYNANCDFIIQKAMALSGQEKFDESLSVLARVPTVCAKCHEFASEAAVSVYKAKQDRDCRVSMAKAKAEMTAENYRSAAMALATGITPGALCYDEASKLMADIEKKAEARNKRDWDFAMKAYDDAVDIRKQEVAAWRAVGVAYGENQQPSTNLYRVNGWW
ncbi:MAG: hypothetical protein IPM12_02730 [Flavobacteriales bacterium]|nr:hypothetical protein [Flavobacteriales bacterium]